MAPFTRKSCPICLVDTTQHFLLHKDPLQAKDGDLWAICESCQTVLLYREDGSVGQRTATEQERAVLPPRLDLSKEPWPTLREELRRGRVEFEAWIQAGCPGLTREMLRQFTPSAIEALARHGVRPAGEGGEVQEGRP